jgi:oligosaccharide repeat unit polymerase
MVMLDWILSLVAALLLLLLAVVARRQFGSWLSPSALLSLYWAAALLGCLFLAPDFQLWPGAAWYVLLVAYAFYYGFYLTWKYARQEDNRPGCATAPPAAAAHFRGVETIILACCLLGFISAALLVSGAGYSLAQVIQRPVLLAATGDYYATLRYAMGASPPRMAILLNSFVYLGSILGGMLLALRRSRLSAACALLPLVPGVLQLFLLSARAAFLYQLCFVAAGYCAMLVLQRRHRNVITRARAAQLVLALALMLTLGATIQMLREGETLRGAPVTVAKMRVIVFGSPIVFSRWLAATWDAELAPGWGANTLGGLFDLTGLTAREQALGWQHTTFLVGDRILPSNIHTGFRQLIEDFTLPGTLLLFVVGGVLVGRAYHGVLNGSLLSLPVLVIFYAVLLGSYSTILLYYNSFLFALLLFSLLVPLLSRWRLLTIGSLDRAIAREGAA